MWSTPADVGSIDQAGVYVVPKRAAAYLAAVAVTISEGETSVTTRTDVFATAGTLTQTMVKPDSRITLGAGQSQQFVAGGADQYGNRITDVSIAWTAAEGGVIDKGGLFVAGAEAGVFNNAVTADISQGDVTLTTKVDVTVEGDRITYYSIDADGRAVDIFTVDPDGAN